MENVNLSITIPVSKRRIADLLISAFEGGSNYWYIIDKFVVPTTVETWVDEDGKVYRHGDYPLSPGGALIISAQDDHPKAPHRLDLAAIEKGLAIFAEKQPRHFGDWLSENDDATTGDVFLQCCLFGEVLFG